MFNLFSIPVYLEILFATMSDGVSGTYFRLELHQDI